MIIVSFSSSPIGRINNLVGAGADNVVTYSLVRQLRVLLCNEAIHSYLLPALQLGSQIKFDSSCAPDIRCVAMSSASNQQSSGQQIMYAAVLPVWDVQKQTRMSGLHFFPSQLEAMTVT